MHEKAKDAFMKELVAAMKTTQSAGSAITSDAAQRTHTLIEQAIADGAEIIAGDNKLIGRSSLHPSVLGNINEKSKIRSEEIWGPSATFATFSSDKEAIEIANRTDYGLSASIFTRDYARALRIGRDLDFGQVQVNAFTLHVSSTAPVTGHKGSGWGSNGGGYGVEEFTFHKHICLCP